MLRSARAIFLLVGIGLTGGLALDSLLALPSTYAQESAGGAQGGRILVHGHGTADSSRRPPTEHMRHHFTLLDSPRHSFKVIPRGKRFVLTDIMLHDKGSVRQKITINIADAMPQIERANILLQIPFEPGRHEQVHLCSGYVIGSGHALVAWTNAGIEPDQLVNISVTGYLEDEF